MRLRIWQLRIRQPAVAPKAARRLAVWAEQAGAAAGRRRRAGGGAERAGLALALPPAPPRALNESGCSPALRARRFQQARPSALSAPPRDTLSRRLAPARPLPALAVAGVVMLAGWLLGGRGRAGAVGCFETATAAARSAMAEWSGRFERVTGGARERGGGPAAAAGGAAQRAAAPAASPSRRAQTPALPLASYCSFTGRTMIWDLFNV